MYKYFTSREQLNQKHSKSNHQNPILMQL